MENFDNYFEHVYWSDDMKMKNYLLKKGVIRKKKADGIGKFLSLDSKHEQMIKLYSNGKYLAFFDNPVKIDSQCNAFVVVKEITEIISDVKGSVLLIIIKLPKDELEIEFQTVLEKEDWVKTLIFLAEYYSSRKSEFESSLKPPLSNDINLKLMAENEALFHWKSIIGKNSLKQFLIDKNLNDMVESIPPNILKNRFVISKIKKKKLPRKGVEVKRLSVKSPSITGNIMKKFSSNEYTILLVGALPLNFIDYRYLLEDKEVLMRESLPDFIDFNTVYFYQYEGTADNSPVKKSLEVKSIESVTVESIVGGYSLQLTLQSKIYTLTFSNAWEAQSWYNAIRNSLSFTKNLALTRTGIIKYNIENLYHLYARKKTNEMGMISKNMMLDVSVKSPLDEFAKSLRKFSENLNYFCDAFFVHQDFDRVFYILMMRNFNDKIKSSFEKQWNFNYQKMNGADILSLAGALFEYSKILSSWNLIDTKIFSSFTFIMRTFITRLFEKTKEIIYNLITDIKSGFFIQNGKSYLKSEKNLETQLYFFFEHFNQLPTYSTAEQLLEFCIMILNFYFLNLREFMKVTTDTDRKCYIGILNNHFMRLLRNFQKKVNQESLDFIKAEEVKEQMDEDYFVRTITDLENLSLAKLTKSMRKEFSKRLAINKQFILDWDYMLMVTKIMDEFKAEIDLIENEMYAEELNQKLIEKSVNVYIKKLIDSRSKINSKNYEAVVNKILSDREKIEKFMYQRKIKGNEIITFKFTELYTLLENDDVDVMIKCILNLFVFYKGLALPKNLGRLLSCKIYFPIAGSNLIVHYLSESFEEENKNKQISRIIKKMGTGINNPMVTIFIQKLSLLKRERRHKKKETNRLLQINYYSV